MSIASEDLIERIYEASVIPEHWPSVLKDLAAFSGCKDGMLVANPQRPDARWVATDDLVPAMMEFARGGWAARNTKAARLAPMRHAGFVRDSDIFLMEEMESDPLYVDLLRRHGFWFSVGTMVDVPTGDLLVFDIERELGRPPVEPDAVARLDGLRPHLARAALIAARLGLERSRAMAAALGAIGLPAAVFGSDHGVRATNGLLDRLSSQFLTRAGGRMALADAPAQSLFEAALAQVSSATSHRGVMSFPVPAAGDDPALIVHLVPIRRTAHDLFVNATALLVATPLSVPRAPAETLLSGLFDLTPAEARVARGVIEGRPLQSIAAKAGVSRETVRGQLKAVFGKTGTRRQVDLVALLVGRELPAGAVE